MILIDTSVWISFFRGKDIQLTTQLTELLLQDRAFLTGIVLVEVLQGAFDEKECKKIISLFEPLKIVQPNPDTWLKAGLLSHQLRKKGLTVSTTDILIATIAIENGLHLFSLDKDFQRISLKTNLKLYT